MADAPNLELPQPLLTRLREGQRRQDIVLARISDDVADMKLRTTNLEEALAGLNLRLDRLDSRVDRIERWVGLMDA